MYSKCVGECKKSTRLELCLIYYSVIKRFEKHFDVRDKLAKARSMEAIREVVSDVEALFTVFI